jgi:hypothetical protein
MPAGHIELPTYHMHILDLVTILRCDELVLCRFASDSRFQQNNAHPSEQDRYIVLLCILIGMVTSTFKNLAVPNLIGLGLCCLRIVFKSIESFEVRRAVSRWKSLYVNSTSCNMYVSVTTYASCFSGSTNVSVIKVEEISVFL